MPTLNLTTKTTPSSIDHTIPEKWNAKLYYQSEAMRFWSKFEGQEGSGMPVIRKDDFSKEAMDVIRIQTVRNLSGNAITGASTLQGNEEKVSLTQTNLTIDWVRFAVAITARSEREMNVDFESQIAQPLLARRMAKAMDDAIWTKFGTATTALYAGNATSTATVGSDDTFSTLSIDRVKTYLDSNNAMPFIDKNGFAYYGIVISPFDAYNLRRDTVWQTANRDGHLRGGNNPIFTGSLGVYNGVIIYTNNNVQITNNISKCIAFGGESIFRGYGMLPKLKYQKYDYDMESGIAVQAVYGEALNNSVNTNFAIIEAYAADPNA